MQITVDNYPEFYLGEGSEKYIQAEFYSIGYEAAKTSPDIGYDLIVTNCARKKFFGEKTRQYNIQVKSRICYEKTVCFFIDDEEYNNLLKDEDGYLICVLCKPELSEGRANIVISRDLAVECLSEVYGEIEKELVEDIDFLTLEGLNEKNISYVGYVRTYVWFNNAQLKRLDEEKLAFRNSKGQICINIEISSMKIINKDNKAYNVKTNTLYGEPNIGYEQQHIKYLVNCDCTDNKMFKGDVYL